MTHRCVILFFWRISTTLLWRLAALYAKIPLHFVGKERLPAKHCNGAVLQLLMYKYWASSCFLFSIIGRVGSHESLTLVSIGRSSLSHTHWRQFALDCKVCIYIYIQNIFTFSAWSPSARTCQLLPNNDYNTIHTRQIPAPPSSACPTHIHPLKPSHPQNSTS